MTTTKSAKIGNTKFPFKKLKNSIKIIFIIERKAITDIVYFLNLDKALRVNSDKANFPDMEARSVKSFSQ